MHFLLSESFHSKSSHDIDRPSSFSHPNRTHQNPHDYDKNNNKNNIHEILQELMKTCFGLVGDLLYRQTSINCFAKVIMSEAVSTINRIFAKTNVC